MTHDALSRADFLRRLREESAAFGRVLATGDLDAAVPHCPGWTLTDVAAHLGGVHRWARNAVLTGPGPDEFPAPSGREALLAWFAEGAAALLGTLAAADLASPCWTFGPKPRTVAFWIRRQAHETCVHRWDAESSQGAMGGIDEALAADGIDEIVDMFFPRQVRLERIPPLAHSLRLSPDGAAPRTLAGDGTAPPDTAEAEVSGPAEAVLLLLWGRADLDDPRLTLTGDRAAALDVLGAGITP